MNERKYEEIVKHYESCLEKHGDTVLGVDWPNEIDAETRYRVMLDLVKFKDIAPSDVTLLDFGCGTGRLLEFMMKEGYKRIKYSGLDISSKFSDLCRSKFPETLFINLDLLANPDLLDPFDFIVMNGVFTEKRGLSFDEMFSYFKDMIRIVFTKARRGIAFNVMSKEVDWEREDLFHLPHDLLVHFLAKEVSRNYVIRNDYGLFEYTVYVYKRS